MKVIPVFRTGVQEFLAWTRNAASRTAARISKKKLTDVGAREYPLF
jgi:hypothetical protein